ncbi:hypothetical protein GDO81_014562 [Engystomops pustulosus]|uniref:Uncharacterized protein n=1 Tax=Engystomops pustulosus TaxID=76066 RepID=A0AAV7BBH4_ENGPU|nr:hypothetical protein GDO81_014562 [Engystomops pustulosus]
MSQQPILFILSLLFFHFFPSFLPFVFWCVYTLIICFFTRGHGLGSLYPLIVRYLGIPLYTLSVLSPIQVSNYLVYPLFGHIFLSSHF